MLTIIESKRRYYSVENNEWVHYKLLKDNVEIGGASVIEFEEKLTYLERIDIFDEYQNQGYGTKLIEWLANHYSIIYAAPDNPNSKRLFNRIGTYEHRELQGYNQGYGIYRIDDYSSSLNDIEFRLKHELEQKPKSEPRKFNMNPLNKPR